MTKELIHIWMALCLTAAFVTGTYIFLQDEYRTLEKRVMRLEAITFDSSRCPKL